MYLINRWLLIAIFLLAILVILAIALNAYSVFLLLITKEDLTIKFYLENILFFALLGILALITFMIYTFCKSRSIYERLDKIIELSHFGNQALDSHFKNLGKLGEKLSDIFANLDMLNNMKSLKISALNSLYRFLVERSDKKLIVINLDGDILAISKNWAKLFEVNGKDWEEAKIDKFLKEVDLITLINNLRHSKSVAARMVFPLEPDSTEEEIFTFYPITNNKGDLTYCVGIKEEDEKNH